VDAVRSDDDIRFRNGSVRKRHPGHIITLLTTGAAVASVHHVRRQRGGQDFDEVGAVHSECGVPTRRVRYLHRRNWHSVVTQVLRARSDPGSKLFYCLAEAHPLELAYAVRRQENARPDLAQIGRLLIYGDLKPANNQRIRSEQAADPATNDHNLQPLVGH
jgi:hypothetical protein